MNAHQRNFEILQDREKAGRIQSLLFSAAWIEDFTPALAVMRETSISQLLDPSKARQDQVSDDYLRARVHILDELLSAGRNFLAEFEAARQQEINEAAIAEGYQARADDGRFAPMPGY